MENLDNYKDVYDIIEMDIEPKYPKTAKVLKFFLIPLIIASISMVAGIVASLIVRSFTDYRPAHLAGMVFCFALITLVMYGTLHTIRAYQLYSPNGILNNPKYAVVVAKHKDWLLKVSTGKLALRVMVDAIIVAIVFLAFDFDLKVQIGSWNSAIDSRAFAIATLGIYGWASWSALGESIKSWVKCREHIFNRFGV